MFFFTFILRGRLAVVQIFLQAVIIPLSVSIVLILTLIPRSPRHLVFLLQPPPGVGEPGGHLRQGHLSNDGQHDLLSLSGVRVLPVLIEPGLQRAGTLPGGVLGPGRVPVLELTVWVESWRGVGREAAWMDARTVLQLVLGALEG